MRFEITSHGLKPTLSFGGRRDPRATECDCAFAKGRKCWPPPPVPLNSQLRRFAPPRITHWPWWSLACCGITCSQRATVTFPADGFGPRGSIRNERPPN
jgi:hypothetical protein